MTAAKMRKVAFDPKSFLASIASGRTISDYRKGAIIFSQGDPADALFYIQTGRVKITVTSAEGKEAVLAILGTGEFFGEACLIAEPLRLATVSAIADCKVTRLEKAEMIRVIHDEPAFAEMFLSYLLYRNIRIEEDLVNQLVNSSEKRLARTLLLLANFGKEGKPEPIMTKITHETLAEMVGTTRARVTFFMNKFRKLGYIDYSDHLRVHSGLSKVVTGESASGSPNP